MDLQDCLNGQPVIVVAIPVGGDGVTPPFDEIGGISAESVQHHPVSHRLDRPGVDDFEQFHELLHQGGQERVDEMYGSR